MSENWEIPLVDISALVENFNSECAIKIGKEFTNAAKNFGFVTIKGHGVQLKLMENMISAMDKFMELKLEERMKYCVNNDDHGYFPAAKDGKEGFDIRIRGIQWPNENGDLDGIFDTKMPNENFEDHSRKYITEMSKLAKILLKTIARSENFGNELEKTMPGHRSFLRVNYYPRRAAAFAEGSDGEPLNCVEHFDSGLITLLYQDYIGGLQVQRPSDMKWIDVPPVEGCLVINTGRAMERIMNGKSVATKHRVKFTENVLRHSIPYFVQPNANAEFWPFGTPESERNFEKVKYLDWYNTNIRKNFPEYSYRSTAPK